MTRPGDDGPELLGRLADAVPHLVWVAGSDGNVREYGGRIAAYAGPRNAADDGWTWELMVHPDDLEDTVRTWSGAVGAGATYEHEHRLRMADGEYRWHLSRGVPRTLPGGEMLWYGTATDIHDVRDAEERLRRTQSALALAMRGGQIGWWQRDLTTEAVTWSPELEDLFGLPPGSFSGDRFTFLDFVHPDDRESISRAVARAIETGDDYVVEFRFRHTDGSWRWMEGRGRATYEDGRPTFLHGIGMDITGRKETEAAIRASEERLRLAAEVGGFGLYDYDLEHGGMYWSPELHEILGTEGGEAASLGDAAIHADDREATLERFAAAQLPASDGSFDFEFRMIRPDGTVRWVSTHGQTYFSHPDPDERRQALRSIGVVMDITERKQADDLRDVFVGMLSHELRTPVTSIYGGSQVLRRGHVDEATRHEIIDDIITESERLERLVENLLVLARAERHVSLGGRDPVLLRPLLTRVIEEKRRRFPSAVIAVDIEPGLPPVTSDDASVELVVRNLISNAIKYGPAGGTVVVTCRRDGDIVLVSVADEGPGIPTDDPNRIFELFYRTDEARLRAQGAGIGLFVVRVLVEGSGGQVAAVNRAAGGSEFSFSLPVFVEADDGPPID